MLQWWSCSTTPTSPRRRPSALVGAAFGSCLIALAACSQPAANSAGAPSGPPAPSSSSVPSARLNEQIARLVGDPSLCVLLADRATGEIVYRYGQPSNCMVQLPACDRNVSVTAEDQLRTASAEPHYASCDSAPGRRVGWASGPAAGRRQLNYSAVMESDRALPGREIDARLHDAFLNAGL